MVTDEEEGEQTNVSKLKSKRSAKTVAGFRVEMGHDS